MVSCYDSQICRLNKTHFIDASFPGKENYLGQWLCAHISRETPMKQKFTLEYNIQSNYFIRALSSPGKRSNNCEEKSVYMFQQQVVRCCGNIMSICARITVLSAHRYFNFNIRIRTTMRFLSTVHAIRSSSTRIIWS